ncbi:MAG TPA: hypothetical protein VG272_06150 [Candidatus Acidoferrales bacterium]|jgi:hypothetical protein|nr:hypothetical protein [Candidatus Acidoferrales bacterium]
MDHPDEIPQILQSHIRTMTETQIVESLRAFAAFRRNEREMLGWLRSVSLMSTEDSTGEIDQLKSDLNLYRRPPVSPFRLWDHLEEALKKRLETLRKRPNNNS